MQSRGLITVALLLVLVGGSSRSALANAAHHPASQGAAQPVTQPAPAQEGISAPAPSSQAATSPDGLPAVLPQGVTEVPLSDTADIGVPLETDARQPTLYDLMMRVMNLMQPHMKEMMGSVPLPDMSAAPNLVVDLANPLGVKSTSKATPEAGGSGGLIVTPAGLVDPVSANMGGGMGTPGAATAAASPLAPAAPAALPVGNSTDPQRLRDEMVAIINEIAALNKKVAAMAATLDAAQTSPAQASQAAPPTPSQIAPTPATSATPAAQTAPAAPAQAPSPAASGTRIEL